MDSKLPLNWIKLRKNANNIFYIEQGEHTIYEFDSGGRRYPIAYAFDAFTGERYRKDARGWQLHHIDHDENNNKWDNFLWVWKPIDPKTGKTSHITRFSNDISKREYIAIGMITKIAFQHGYAPPIWSYENQAYYYYILRTQRRRFITK